jgi:hypothetical protein
MQGCPAFVVCLVHSGTLLHQEAHHLQVLIDAGLKVGQACELSPRPGLPVTGEENNPDGL